ncbi:MAG: helix-turn-helix domain-containing protein [Armatimonadota bacterium]
MRKKRLDFGLFQKDVAQILGVSTPSVQYWETNRVFPCIASMSKIVKFIGYTP